MGIGLSKTIDMGSRMIINSWETTIKMIQGSNGKRPYPPTNNHWVGDSLRIMRNWLDF
jgi:hypothetical protein